MLTNGSFTLNDTGAVSQPYILAEATNLISPITWPFVFTNTADMNGVFNFIDPLKTDYAQRFYRAILP